MNGYPSYNYYGQPIYPQQPSAQNPYAPNPYPQPAPHGYPQWYPPHPSQIQQPAPVIPQSYEPESYTNGQNHASTSKSRKGNKRASAPVGSISAPAQPLKSALKKSSAMTAATPMLSMNTMEFPQTHHTGYPITRQRTTSGPFNGDRRRTHSNAHSNTDHGAVEPSFVPMHLFISFIGCNELRLENVSELALRDLRNLIWPLWPDGVEIQPIGSNDRLVKFKSQPWDMSGPHYLAALKLLHELFTLCCRRGYQYQTSYNTAQSVPRLIFQCESPDEQSHFFLAFFSQNGRRLTMVNAPSTVDLGLAAQIQKVFPRRTASQVVPGVEPNAVRHITLDPRPTQPSGVEISPALFFAHVLKILTDLQFELDFSIALQRRQSLGMRTPQEVLVFRTPLRGRVPRAAESSER